MTINNCTNFDCILFKHRLGSETETDIAGADTAEVDTAVVDDFSNVLLSLILYVCEIPRSIGVGILFRRILLY